MRLKRGQISGPLQSHSGKLRLKFALALAASALLFWIDIWTPLSFPDLLLYPILLIYAFYNFSKQKSLYLMFLNMGFIIAGFFASPADIKPGLAAAHRVLIIGSTWAAFFLVWQGRSRDGRLKELEETREALERSERHYHTLYDTMLQGVIYRDANGKVLSINPAAKKILGATPAELTEGATGLIERGVIDEDGLPLKPEDHPFTIAKLTGRPVYDIVIGFVNPAHEARRWLNISAVPLFREGDDKPYQIYTLFHDITEQKTANDQITMLNTALARKIQEMEAIINTAPMGIAISYDPNCKHMEANPYYSRLLGMPLGRNISKSAPEGGPTEFKMYRDGRELSPDDLPMQTAAKQGVWIEKVELEVIRKDGAAINLIGNTAPLFDEDGKPRGSVGAFLDVTELKKAEQQLKDSLKEKEVLLKELYHRTKNNLNVVSTLLTMQMHSIKDPEMRHVFREAQGRIHSMSLVHEMLYKSQELSMLDLKSYIEELAGHIMDGNKEKTEDIKLVLHLESVPVSIYAAVPCGLIINELLSNGIKHAFPSGAGGEMTISLRNNGGEVELAYLDNGAGMPDGFSIEKSNSLGLKLVDNLARKQLMGKIEIANENGARITLRFGKDRLKKNGV